MTSFYLAAIYLLPLRVACTEAPPSIIFLPADDLGWDDVSFHGSSQIPTPNLDALAADGIILNSHYVQPSCASPRAALLTGLYPIRTGMQGSPAAPQASWGLPLNVTVLPQYLKERGYETHLVGKWDLGYYMKNYTPTFRGFDSFFGYYNAEEDYYTHSLPVGNSSCLDFPLNTDPVRSENGSYSTTLFTQRAQDIIRHRDQSKPLFLLLSYQAVHGSPGEYQLEAPLENIEKFPYIQEINRTIFAGMVDAPDQSVGDVFQTLYECKMLENTVIVFTSDNGGMPWGEVGSPSINWPQRGGKMTLWEGGTRSTAFIWSPLLTRNRTVSNQLIHITDWVPTLYPITGGSVDELGELDGQDMWAHLSQGSQSPRVEFLYDIDETATQARGVRYSKFKLVEDHSGLYIDRYRPPPGRASYQALDDKSAVANVLKNLYGEPELNLPENWRRNATIRCQTEEQNFSPNQTLYLLDIDADPCELDNLASRLPDVVAFMKERLIVYEDSAATPLKDRYFTSVPFTVQDGLCAPWVSPEPPEKSSWPTL